MQKTHNPIHLKINTQPLYLVISILSTQIYTSHTHTSYKKKCLYNTKVNLPVRTIAQWVTKVATCHSQSPAKTQSDPIATRGRGAVYYTYNNVYTTQSPPAALMRAHFSSLERPPPPPPPRRERNLWKFGAPRAREGERARG